jgi:hypothetical protein
MLFDGRNRAQNGWFVLRSLIPLGKTTGAIVWHIRPDVIPNIAVSGDALPMENHLHRRVLLVYETGWYVLS